MKYITYLFAVKEDEGQIVQLLCHCGLPHKNISKYISCFIVAKKKNEIVGVICLRSLHKVGLMRSLAVKQEYRKKKIAQALFSKMLGVAHLKGLDSLYLLTTTAQGYFSRLGFLTIKKNDIPIEIKETIEYKNICPSSSACMGKDISLDGHYYPQEVLIAKPFGKGKKMWSVSLKKTMLTNFEIASYSQFEKHSHPNEQITMVLSGELFFEVNDTVIKVKKGEVAAFPPGVVHRAYTKDMRVKAVDAWSPVMEKYSPLE